MDLSLIKNEIKKTSRVAFKENNIIITDTELDDDVRLFFNFITIHSGFYFIDGLASDMMQAMQAVFVDNIGKLTSLKSIATLFDAFAKKIIIMAGIDNHGKIRNQTMMPLFKIMNIIMPVPIIEESTIESYKGRASGTYIFGVAYLTRNNVHNSPDWDMAEIVRRTRYVVALYIFVIHKLKTKLLLHYPEINQEKLYEYGDNKESQTVYDFISYSKPSNKIKNQVIKSFVSHLLHNHGMHKVEDLVAKVVDFSEKTLSDTAALRLIRNLIEQKVLTYNNGVKTEIILSEEEEERITKLISDYNYSLLLFHSEMDKLILDNNLQIDKSLLIKNLGTFFECNFRMDILEATDQETNKSTWKFYQELISFIKAGGVDDDKANNFFNSMIGICRQNDIIIRISAGRVFSKMSNPEQFSNYVRNLSRNVYLDTQILLYILCINDNYSSYDNIFFKVAKNIVDLGGKNKKFILKVSKHYLSEIVYQLKQALLLIQFLEISNMPKSPISTNVFYRYYYWLNENDGLPEGIVSYRDFMQDMFGLKEDEAFHSDFEVIANGVVESMLSENFGIVIEPTPHFDNILLGQVQELYKQVLKDNWLGEKPYKPLLNDSLTCMVLFERTFDQPEPFFLTWDKTFSFMRIEYKKKFKRGSSSLFFHLFSPAKFVNHVDLVDFRVNANTLSDDLLSLIESHHYTETTYNIIDTINRFLDIPDITPEKRSLYIKKLQKEIYRDEVFLYEQSEIEQTEATNRKSFAFISQELFNHFKDKGQGAMKNYRTMLLNEEAFEMFIKIVFDYLNDESTTLDISDVIVTMENLVDKYVLDRVSDSGKEINQYF
ncbi:hypothetical protein [uncultured Parabacteroides sp.]|uniref:hypothetical protein n=1 Tax=uncultured Parabacteroides sp. TaxID=512312 RepID=UPI0028055C50|nr:hypothetical protein [uncultured Parabacteroides sp.]